MTETKTAPIPISGLAHIGIRVHDLVRSVRFYALLGFTKTIRGRSGMLAARSGAAFDNWLRASPMIWNFRSTAEWITCLSA